MEMFRRVFYNDNINELQLFERLSYFSQYTFYEDTHTYRFNNELIAKSVTGLVSEFIEPFDEKKKSGYQERQKSMVLARKS